MVTPRPTDWRYITEPYEPGVVETISSLITSETVAVDAGANIGYFTLLLGMTASRVLAIEPDPANVAILERNLKLNAGFYEVLRAAAAEGSGVGFLAEGDSPATSHLADSGLAVALVGIGDVAPHATFVKIDVEGAELAALHGLGDLAGRADLLIELHASDDAAVRVLLSEWGYHVSEVASDTEHLLALNKGGDHR
jgi:FkbM family methyltransferase